jgi:hypothetical protein
MTPEEILTACDGVLQRFRKLLRSVVLVFLMCLRLRRE